MSEFTNGDIVTCPRCGGDAVQRVQEYDIPGFMRAYRWIACPPCHAQAEKVEMARVAAEAKEWVRKAKNDAGIRGPIQDRSLDGFSTPLPGQGRALAAARLFAAQDGPCWLAFCGATGTGKSHLAVAIANQAVEGGCRSVCYAKLIGMMRRFRATFHDDADETERQVARRYRSVRLLIVDEFGVRGELTEWERATLDDILDYRWEQKARTIIISNMAPDKMFESAGERIESRFADLGAIVRFTWVDHRKNGKVK